MKLGKLPVVLLVVFVSPPLRGRGLKQAKKPTIWRQS